MGEGQGKGKMININEFVNYCQSQVGKEFYTLWLHKPFYIISSNSERIWYKNSKVKERVPAKRYIEAYLGRYNQTKSLRPKDYKKFIFNGEIIKTTESSYVLTLINSFLNSNKNRG
jgi:hypothetical protein